MQALFLYQEALESTVTLHSADSAEVCAVDSEGPRGGLHICMV